MSTPPIFLATAPAADEPSVWFVAALGITVVMLGLTCIILLCMLTSFVCTRLFDKSGKNAPETRTSAPVPTAAPAFAPIPNRGELIAAISAALAEELGQDVSAIRIHSIRPLTAGAPTQMPNRGEVIAAISAAIAEDLGTEVSALRIHSVRQIG